MPHELQNPATTAHELTDAPAGPIVLSGAALALLVVIFGFLGYAIWGVLVAHRPTVELVSPLAPPDQIPPSPRIEEHPSEEVQQLHIQEDRILSTYGWMDKGSGIVRIPIDRAMQLQLERGFPTRKEQPPR